MLNTTPAEAIAFAKAASFDAVMKQIRYINMVKKSILLYGGGIQAKFGRPQTGVVPDSTNMGLSR